MDDKMAESPHLCKNISKTSFDDDGSSEIVEFFRNSTIFLTGATGFLGKLCIVKLLRTCPSLKKIYILMRPKKGKEVQTRFTEVLNEPIFGPLREEFPTFTDKIEIICGDVSQPFLGLSEEDTNKLITEVNHVLHFAATVRFDEHIRTATYTNIRGVRDILLLCRKINNLQAVLHVSTAYSNCDKESIQEKFYEPPISGEKLITLMDCLDDDKLSNFTPLLLEKFPNTYTFTKCVAEDIVRTVGKDLPVALLRPSIITSTYKEPLPGWIDNIYGVVGLTFGVALGLLRTLRGRMENLTDIVPADYVINSCLAVTWEVGVSSMTSKEKNEKPKVLPVFNFVCTPEKPINIRKFIEMNITYLKKVPSEKCIWHYLFLPTPNKYLYMLLVFLLHTVPAYLVDFVAMCLGKEQLLVKGYRKINKFANVLSYFCMQQWDFANNNTQALWNRMNKKDKELFEFSMKLLDWDLYFYNAARGGRMYLLKDPLDTVPKGIVKYYKLMIIHYTLLAILGFLFFKLLMFIF